MEDTPPDKYIYTGVWKFRRAVPSIWVKVKWIFYNVLLTSEKLFQHTYF